MAHDGNALVRAVDLMTFDAKSPDAGFTLTEMLVALLIISLSMAGLLAAVKLVSRYDQRLVAARNEARDVKTFAANLETQLLTRQPIEDNRIDGDGKTLGYPCDASIQRGVHDCHLSVPQGELSFISQGETLNSWPIQNLKPGETRRLEAVIWRSAAGKTLAIVKLPVEQGADCQFDMISRTCRALSQDQRSAAGG
jgi:prepilin-type N-terminal cleavage/methylation domain-containing protein